jgi:hypothetical protein
VKCYDILKFFKCFLPGSPSEPRSRQLLRRLSAAKLSASAAAAAVQLVNADRSDDTLTEGHSMDLGGDVQ